MVGETKWQPVYYKDDQRSFVANMPGEPRCLLSKGTSYIYNMYHDIHYLISPSAFTLPDTIDEFLNLFRDILDAEITVLESQQPCIRYLIDIRFKTEEGVLNACRAYATSNSLYCLMVSGKDLSLANDFFNSVKIEEQ